MARKADLIEQAQEMGLKVTAKNTIAEIEALIAGADQTEAKEESTKEVTVAKAGKRSAKALREAEEEAAKEESKDSDEDEEDNRLKKGPAPVTRPKSERRSKAYKKAFEKVEQDKAYALVDAMKLATETSVVKFDATVELHVNLGVNPRHSDQNIRENVTLPHGTGKEVRVAVFAPADLHDDAKKAGADIVGEDSIIEKLKNEEINFDVLVATPRFMPQLGKFAKMLGPKGLMPNPKSGTVTQDVAAAVKQAKAGRVEFRVDSYGIIHLGVGKVSFGAEKLAENATAVMDVIKSVKPQSIKGVYIQSVNVSTTMGPSITVEV